MDVKRYYEQIILWKCRLHACMHAQNLHVTFNLRLFSSSTTKVPFSTTVRSLTACSVVGTITYNLLNTDSPVLITETLYIIVLISYIGIVGKGFFSFAGLCTK